MLILSKWFLMAGGIGLIIDSILMAVDIPNPLFDWPLPCPLTIFLLGTGIVLFGIKSKAFKN